MAKALTKLDINWRNGPGEYRLLMDRAKVLASTEDDGFFDLEEANEAIGELEVLFYYGNSWRPWAPPMEDLQDFAKLSRTLAMAIIQLKERVFRHQASPRLRGLMKGGPKICQYCYWALERIGRGHHGALSDPRTENPARGCFECTHLCAVESSQHLPLLEERAREGCDLCRFLREHFVASLQGSDTNHEDACSRAESEAVRLLHVWVKFDWDDVPMQPEQSGNTLRFVTLCVLEEGSAFAMARQLRFLVGTQDSKLARELGLLSSPRPAPLDPVNLTMLRQCLRAEDHGPAKPRFLPKRLLDLNSTDATLPRVVDTRPGEGFIDGQPVEYAALSYCWGPPEDACRQVLLTAESKERLYKGIQIGELTPVVQDAVTTCRALGLRFLWVDALCIFQHDTTDWEEQSYDMEKVFAGSSLTVCAMATTSCLEGFLQRTKARLDLPLLPANSSSSEAGIISLFPCSGDKKRLLRPFYGVFRQGNSDPPLQTDLGISSWSTRGWVFQKMPAPRRLYFGADMIHVQVGNVITSENGYVFEDKFDYRSSRNQPRYSIMRDEILSHSDLFPDMWYSVIEEFSKLYWSDDHDTLPGLSGVARMFQDMYEFDYVAGLWVNDIECGLLWNSLPNEWGDTFRNGKNPLGRTRDAALHVSGMLLEVPGAWKTEGLGHSEFWYTVSGKEGVLVNADWHLVASVEDDYWRKSRLLLLASCCSELPETITDRARGRRDSVLNDHVRVTYRQEYRRTFYQDRNRGDDGPGRCTLCGPGHERDAWGLLIYPAAQPGTYYRVGTFLFRAMVGGLGLFDRGYVDTITLI
ncbi:HET-domain-containing protein [Apiospora hydei]|uniref:HET-domain-containing protein n=1 Tax=Apiospora hydei TaxID=1337664 RepID=A0ABR1WQG2_9PEZI